MANALLDLIGDVGYALDTPGAYLRGALSGRPGERASGEQMLGAYGVDAGPVGGFLAETLLDPTDLLLGGGAAAGGAAVAQKLRDGGTLSRRLAGLGRDTAGGMTRGELGLGPNPLADRLREFAANEDGYVDLDRAAELLRSGEGPLGRLGRMAKHTPAGVGIDEETLRRKYFYPTGAGLEWPYAVYEPPGPSMVTMSGVHPGVPPEIIPNLTYDFWGDDAQAAVLSRRLRGVGGHGGPRAIPGPAPDLVGVHEVGHALHRQRIDGGESDIISPADYWSGDVTAGPRNWLKSHRPGLAGEIERSLGTYATLSPAEFVADSFAREVLGRPLPGGLRRLYDDLLGPDPDDLPPEFWDIIQRRR